MRVATAAGMGSGTVPHRGVCHQRPGRGRVRSRKAPKTMQKLNSAAFFFSASAILSDPNKAIWMANLYLMFYLTLWLECHVRNSSNEHGSVFLILLKGSKNLINR
jgi:hypothetical protein